MPKYIRNPLRCEREDRAVGLCEVVEVFVEYIAIRFHGFVL